MTLLVSFSCQLPSFAELRFDDTADFDAMHMNVAKFANARRLSSSMVAYRLYDRRVISYEMWFRLKVFFRDQWIQKRAEQRVHTRESEGGPSYYVVRRHRLGTALVRLVRRMMAEGVLSPSKAAKILGVKPMDVQTLLHPERLDHPSRTGKGGLGAYLLDASILITAHTLYYPIDRVLEFWEWLIHVGLQSHVKIPIELYEEITDGRHALVDWAKNDEHRIALLLDEEVDADLVARVIVQGYAPDLTDEEIEKIGCDAFLIAHALAAPMQRCVVTAEMSKPRRTRANRHIPDVCETMAVSCMSGFQLFRTLDFKTSWRTEG